MKHTDLDIILSILSLAIALGYIYLYMLAGHSNPSKYRYQKVINDKKLLFKHFIAGSLLAILAAVRYHSATPETFYLSPMIFLLLLLFFNYLINKLYKRNIIIESVYIGYRKYNKSARFLDRFFGFLAVMIALLIPLILYIKR